MNGSSVREAVIEQFQPSVCFEPKALIRKDVAKDRLAEFVLSTRDLYRKWRSRLVSDLFNAFR